MFINEIEITDQVAEIQGMPDIDKLKKITAAVSVLCREPFDENLWYDADEYAVYCNVISHEDLCDKPEPFLTLMTKLLKALDIEDFYLDIMSSRKI